MSHVDELISASLSNDLTDAERERMDAHLATCQRCRDTLSAFSDQRRLISGMRHVAAPRDLGARVRVGIESGRRPGLPWWRRPGGILAVAASATTAVAALLLAVLIFRPGNNVSVLTTPSATASVDATPTVQPTESPVPTPTPTAPPSVEPTPTLAPVVGAKPAGYFSYTLTGQTFQIDYVTADGDHVSLPVKRNGWPSRAALSPDGHWLAFRVDGDQSGLSDFYAYDLVEQNLVDLGQSMTPIYGIGDEISWSPDSAYLAWTLTTPNTERSDVWVMDVNDAQPRQLTTTGDAYAASWLFDSSLWISQPGDQPVSRLVAVYGEGVPDQFDPADPAVNEQTVNGVFDVLMAPDAQHAIFWRGRMGTPGGHWSFGEAGMPYVADVKDGTVDFGHARQLFSTIAPMREAFQGARITWGADSNAFAVWDAAWTGTPQGDRFPDRTRVYFGHLDNAELLTEAQALDPADTAAALNVVDVAIAPDGEHLALTMLIEAGSEGGEFGAVAELRLITRGYGTDPDGIKLIGQKGAWNGPAVYQPVGGR